MKLSHAWLRQFVPAAPDADAVADLLTARCATVEEVERLRADLAGVVIGRVVEAARHPNAEKLWVTRVDAGGPEPLDVVCGAPNVKAGALYPFAPVGTTLPGGITLERRKIRGELSNGMLCSARELGLGQDHEGILELATDAAPGTPFLQAYPAGDVRIVIDVLPNRPDLLSHLGVAREVAAAVRGQVARPAELGGPVKLDWADGSEEARADEVAVRIAPDAATPLYMGVVVRGVKVGPSPEWLVERLEAVGSRSINNVVDATNYVLHAFGQPTHAFDLAKLGGSTVVVRPAVAGERIVTLDGAERTLAAGMTVIADATRPQAVAGVMGGSESEVGEGTTDVFLEIARFDPRQVRRTRRALGISTDASYRFERGLDPQIADAAAAELVSLVLSVAGGRVAGAARVRREPPAAPAVVRLRSARVDRLLGVEVPTERIVELLGSIGFRSERVEDGVLDVTVPGWRLDVSREVDLVEEVARLHGYDALPDDIRPFRPGTVPDAPLVAVTERVRDALVAAGLYEARPLPFVPARDGECVPVLNPLAENESSLRTTVLETLARRAEYNLSHLVGNVRLFEIGTVFTPSGSAIPREAMHVGALVMGDRRPVHFTEPRPPRYDAWDAKALAERVADAAYPGRSVALEAAGEGGGLWRILVDGDEQGRVIRVELDAPEWAAPAFGVELRIGDALETEVAGPRPGAARYVALPTTPPAVFDLALIVPDGTPAGRVAEVIGRTSGDMLERLELFDEYRGSGVPAGHRSLAWRLTFRHPERTLRDKEIEGRRARLLRVLEEEIGVRPRV
ncbi:MAG TPA: phenylalanine--tRNA ligase subunit beta [Gemmatimonadales bacterium]